VAHEAYTKEDLELLETLGSQVAIAIENAKLYHQVQDLSQNLQKKVDEQTRKIRNAYELEKKAHKELKRLDEVKSQFIMATQHHLRTPLTAMKGYVSMILEGDFGEVSPKTKEKLKGFQSSIERLINLVNEFLDISQIQLGKGILNLKKTKIDDLISEIVEELKPEAQRKNLYFRFEKPSSLPEIKADKEKLREAIFDIVDNAIRYTQRGGVEVKLNINPPAGGQRLNIIVKDTGIGLEKEEKKRLFGEIFARGKKAKEVYTLGRGIGLFIARNIIEAHRGKVWAESGGRNRGSTFFIEIPTG